MSMPTLTREHGVAHLMVPLAWRNGTFREKSVVFSESHLPFLANAIRAFLAFEGSATGESMGDGDALTTQVGGHDTSPSLIVQNTRGGETAGTVWLTEEQARELLSILG